MTFIELYEPHLAKLNILQTSNEYNSFPQPTKVDLKVSTFKLRLFLNQELLKTI